MRVNYLSGLPPVNSIRSYELLKFFGAPIRPVTESINAIHIPWSSGWGLTLGSSKVRYLVAEVDLEYVFPSSSCMVAVENVKT